MLREILRMKYINHATAKIWTPVTAQYLEGNNVN